MIHLSGDSTQSRTAKPKAFSGLWQNHSDRSILLLDLLKLVINGFMSDLLNGQNECLAAPLSINNYGLLLTLSARVRFTTVILTCQLSKTVVSCCSTSHITLGNINIWFSLPECHLLSGTNHNLLTFITSPAQFFQRSTLQF